jgi:hypothetical protein
MQAIATVRWQPNPHLTFRPNAALVTVRNGTATTTTMMLTAVRRRACRGRDSARSKRLRVAPSRPRTRTARTSPAALCRRCDLRRPRPRVDRRVSGASRRHGTFASGRCPFRRGHVTHGDHADDCVACGRLAGPAAEAGRRYGEVCRAVSAHGVGRRHVRPMGRPWDRHGCLAVGPARGSSSHPEPCPRHRPI